MPTNLPSIKTARLYDNWLDVVNYSLERWGYILVGSNRPYVLGQTVPDSYGMRISFYVAAETTYEEAVEHTNELNKMASAEIFPPPPGWHFYKCKLITNSKEKSHA